MSVISKTKETERKVSAVVLNGKIAIQKGERRDKVRVFAVFHRSMLLVLPQFSFKLLSS